MLAVRLIPTCNGGLVTARSLQVGDCVLTADGEEKVVKSQWMEARIVVYTPDEISDETGLLLRRRQDAGRRREKAERLRH